MALQVTLTGETTFPISTVQCPVFSLKCGSDMLKLPGYVGASCAAVPFIYQEVLLATGTPAADCGGQNRNLASSGGISMTENSLVNEAWGSGHQSVNFMTTQLSCNLASSAGISMIEAMLSQGKLI